MSETVLLDIYHTLIGLEWGPIREAREIEAAELGVSLDDLDAAYCRSRQQLWLHDAEAAPGLGPGRLDLPG